MSKKGSSYQLEAELDSEELDGIHYKGNKGTCFGARHMMIILVAIGSGFVVVTNISFSVILVAMTTSNTSSNPNIPTYDWNNKGVLLSSNIWLGIPVQLISGPLGKKYGHKWLILGSFIINSLFYILIPAFAELGGSAGVMFCRIISGGAAGMMGPLVVSVSGLWVPVEERSKAGMIGVAITFPFAIIGTLSAGQIAASSLGYPAICYIMGLSSLIWAVFWIILGHQSPATHPRITPEEKKYIETSLNTQKTEHIPVPWKKLLLSVHFWAPVVAGVGSKWIETIMTTVNLIFITKAWKIDIAKSTSTLGIAPVIGLIFGGAMAPLSDFLIKKKYLRIVNARKIFHSISTIGTASCLLWMTWIPADSSIGLIILNLSINNVCFILGGVGGSGLNILDIAPSFAGIIGGFAATFAQCFGLVAPITIDWILTDEGNFSEWRIIFLIAGGIVLVTTIFFDIFATDKRPWDNADEEEKD